MKALITKPFRGMDGDRDRDFADEVVEGAMAQWAVDNGHGEEIDDDAPVGAIGAPRKAKKVAVEEEGDAEPEPKADRRKNRRRDESEEA